MKGKIWNVTLSKTLDLQVDLIIDNILDYKKAKKSLKGKTLRYHGYLFLVEKITSDLHDRMLSVYLKKIEERNYKDLHCWIKDLDDYVELDDYFQEGGDIYGKS